VVWQHICDIIILFYASMLKVSNYWILCYRYAATPPHLVYIQLCLNNCDFSEDIVTPWRWSWTETCRSFLNGFLIKYNCACVGVNNWVTLVCLLRFFDSFQFSVKSGQERATFCEGLHAFMTTLVTSVTTVWFYVVKTFWGRMQSFGLWPWRWWQQVSSKHR
jgi:hypothetical protein